MIENYITVFVAPLCLTSFYLCTYMTISYRRLYHRRSSYTWAGSYAIRGYPIGDIPIGGFAIGDHFLSWYPIVGFSTRGCPRDGCPVGTRGCAVTARALPRWLPHRCCGGVVNRHLSNANVIGSLEINVYALREKHGQEVSHRGRRRQ